MTGTVEPISEVQKKEKNVPDVKAGAEMCFLKKFFSET